MIRWRMCGGLVLLMVMGCGQGEADGTSAQCEAVPQGVILAVNSSLPDLLSQEVCGAAAYLELEAFVLLPDEPSCFVELTSSAVLGCCPVEKLNRSIAATLVVRTVRLEALIEMTKLVSIPSTAGSELVVAFDSDGFDGGMYDADRDGLSNVEEYCAGTL